MRIMSRAARALGWLTQAIGDILDWLALDQLIHRRSVRPLVYKSSGVDTKRHPATTPNQRLA